MSCFKMKSLPLFPPSLFPRCLCLWKYIISEQWASQWKGVYNIFPVDGKGTESIDYHTGKKKKALNSHKLKTLKWYIYGIYLPFHCLSLPPYCSSIPPKRGWSNYSILLFAGEGKTGWQFAISPTFFEYIWIVTPNPKATKSGEGAGAGRDSRLWCVYVCVVSERIVEEAGRSSH